MGFKFTELPESECLFEITDEGDDYKDFLSCAQQALSQVRLSITIDISRRPEVLKAVLPAVLKLQQVLSSHNKQLIISGVPPHWPKEFLDRMQDFGFRMDVLEGSHKIEPVWTTVHGVKDALPPHGVIENQLRELRDRLAETLKRKEYLDREKENYTERLKALAKIGARVEVDSAKLQRIFDLEGELILLKEERGGMTKKLDDAEVEKKNVEQETHRSLQATNTEYKKQKEVSDKKIAELLKVREKLKTDYRKKSDSRAAQKR